jgi:hypothetical protein
MSSIKDLSYGVSKFCALTVDDYAYYSWNIFLKNKSQLKNKMSTLLHDFKISGIDVKFVRCDDSGEYKSFYDSCQVNQHNIKFEFSGPRTPHCNLKLERKIQSFYGRIRVTLNNGGLEDSVRTGIWAECAKKHNLPLQYYLN